MNTGHSIEWRGSADTQEYSPSMYHHTKPPIMSDSVGYSGSTPYNSGLLPSPSNFSSSSQGHRKKKYPPDPSSSESLTNITGGPLSYSYSLTFARLHFGGMDTQGSEHLVDNHPFPAEVSILIILIKY